MAKILVVSDTHGDDAWLSLIKDNNYDYIIHAGDHLMPKEISKITPYYVDGNNDWNQKNINVFTIANHKFVVVHGDEQHIHKSELDHLEEKFDSLIKMYQPTILIYGHTHIPFVARSHNTIIMNPGSMSFSRHNGKKCYIELTLDENGILDVEQKTY